MGFGERFKTLLKKNNLTQRKFAEDTETHQGLITRYIKEEEPPSGSFIMKAVNYFPNDINYLFFGSKESNAVNEDKTSYLSQNPTKILNEIEVKLKELRDVLPQ